MSIRKHTCKNQSASFHHFSVLPGSSWTTRNHQQALGSNSLPQCRCSTHFHASDPPQSICTHWEFHLSYFQKRAETTKALSTLASLRQVYRLTPHPWESKKNPAYYLLASKCYTSLLDQVSPTQACTTSPIWLLCHCMPLVFFLPPTAQTPQLKHIRTLNFTTILAQHLQSFSSWQVATQPIVILARNLHSFLSLPLTSNSSARPIIMYQKYTWNSSTLFIFTASTLIPVIISYQTFLSSLNSHSLLTQQNQPPPACFLNPSFHFSDILL